MSSKASSSLFDLPNEIFYSVFDYFTDFELVCSMRDICPQLNHIIDTYPRYEVSTILKINSE